MSSSFKKLLSSSSGRPPLEKWYGYVLALFIGYVVADLGTLYSRQYMLPAQAPPAKPEKRKRDIGPSRRSYNPITARNLFNSNGEMPPAITLDAETKEEAPQDDTPVLSQLPMTLVGTIVHANPSRSVATIQFRGKSVTKAYRPEQELEGLATLIRVERKRAIFRNLNNSRLEFIEIKESVKIAFAGSKKGPTKEVQQDGNRFVLRRSDIDKYISDLPKLLQQARAVPNRVPGTGEINGFRVLDLDQGSIFEKLGIRKMDVIKSVNGEPVDSPAKAMELYNALKSSDRIAIGIERNGKDESLDYSIE